MKQLRIGIVGSRRRDSEEDRFLVYDIVRRHIVENPDTQIVVVSGACRAGADSFAQQAVEFFKREIGEERVSLVEFPVRKWPGQNRFEFREQAYHRNRLIVENSDRVYALIHEDRTGGTENTVDHCHDLKVPVYLVDGEGRSYLDVMGSDVNKDTDTAGATQA